MKILERLQTNPMLKVALEAVVLIVIGSLLLFNKEGAIEFVLKPFLGIVVTFILLVFGHQIRKSREVLIMKD